MNSWASWPQLSIEPMLWSLAAATTEAHVPKSTTRQQDKSLR